jgi:hypothetical protein
MYGAFSNILIGTGSSTTGTPKKGIVGKNLATGLEYTEHDLLFHAGDRVVPLLALGLCAEAAAQQLDRQSARTDLRAAESRTPDRHPADG